MSQPCHRYLIFALLAPTLALAQAAASLQAMPTFEAYRVNERFTGKAHRPRLLTEQDREFRTELARAAAKRPNFAGHYVLTTVGCGASCVLTAVLDAKTGQVAWLPFTLCCWADEVREPVQFRRDSDLILVSGRRDEGEDGRYAVRFVDGRFVPLNSH